MTVKELFEKRAGLAVKIRGLADKANQAEKREKDKDGNEVQWSAADEQNWLALNKDYDELGTEIGKAERSSRLAKLDEDAQRPIVDPEFRPGREPGSTLSRYRGGMRPLPGVVVSEEKREAAFRSWFKTQCGFELTEDEDEACHELRFNPFATNLDIKILRVAPTLAVVRAWDEKRGTDPQSTAAGAGGEFIAPTTFIQRVERALLMFGGVRQVAEIIRTNEGNALHWPTVDDTGNTGVLLGENAEATVLDVTTSELVLHAYKYSSKLVKVSQELIEDAAFNLAELLGDMLGERIGRAENAAFTTGDGNSKPNGIVTAATQGEEAASQTAITADELIELFHSVDPSYRMQEGVGFMMHDAIVAVVRKLKGEDNQYLWQPGLQAGQPDRLLNAPVTINQSMASALAQSAKVVLFGALRKYKIRDVRTLRLRRLVERYGEFDQEGFVAFHRTDGDLLDAGTHPVKYLQCKTT
jgi:HK97 family phage major capsid protein